VTAADARPNDPEPFPAALNQQLVVPGLDPGIHEALPRSMTLRLCSQNLTMDCRVRPGNDDGELVQAK
jgi:hypothetical protein